MVNNAFAPKFTTPCNLASKCCLYHLCFCFTPSLHFFAPYLQRHLGGVCMRKLAQDFQISFCVYIMTGSFHISLFEGTLHVNKIHVWFKIANIRHALPVLVYRQTDFTPKRVVVSHLHDTAARFRTRAKFSPWYKNRGEITPGWLAPAWNFVAVSCKQI